MRACGNQWPSRPPATSGRPLVISRAAALFNQTDGWLVAQFPRLQVVLAQNIQTGEMAALKVVFLESPNVADDPEHLALLQRWVGPAWAALKFVFKFSCAR